MVPFLQKLVDYHSFRNGADSPSFAPRVVKKAETNWFLSACRMKDLPLSTINKKSEQLIRRIDSLDVKGRQGLSYNEIKPLSDEEVRLASEILVASAREHAPSGSIFLKTLKQNIASSLGAAFEHAKKQNDLSKKIIIVASAILIAIIAIEIISPLSPPLIFVVPALLALNYLIKEIRGKIKASANLAAELQKAAQEIIDRVRERKAC